MLKSIVSYPDRGKWGNNKYRGNCSGYVILDLLKHFKPKRFLEIFAGGGTGKEVAEDLGYTNSIHLDLRPELGGWNALRDEIPTGADFVFSHPPYHDIIVYSGEQWGTEPHPDDLSRCRSYDEFIKKLDYVNAKIYSSLRHGGRHAILIGDIRRKGEYFSIMKDMAFFGKLEAHIIKAQHNTWSERKSYNGDFIPIVHEHILIFKKNEIWKVPVTIVKKVFRDLRQSDFLTWRDATQAALEELGGVASLQDIYNLLEHTEKARKNKHWKEKVRQTLQIYSDFYSVKRGVWALNKEMHSKTA